MGQHFSRLLHRHAHITPEQLEHLKTQLQLQTESSTAKENELEASKKGLGNAKEEASLLQQKVDLLETKLADISKERDASISGLQASIKHNGEAADAQQKELTEKKIAVEKELSEVKQLKATMEAGLADQLAQVKKQLEESQHKGSELQLTNTQLEEQIATLKKESEVKTAAAEVDIAAAQKKLESLTFEHEKLVKESTEKDAAAKSSSEAALAKLMALQASHEELQKSTASQAAAAKTRLEEAQAKLMALQSTHDTLVKDSSEKSSAASKAQEVLQAAHDKLVADLAAAKQSMTDSDAKIKMLTESSATATKQHDETAARLQSEILAIQEAKQKLASDHAAEIEKVKQEAAELQTKVTTVEGERDEAQKKVEEVTEKVTKAEEEVETLKKVYLPAALPHP